MLTERTGQYTPSSSGYELTGRWQRPINTDRTCPVMFSLHWNLTDVDRTLDLQSLVTC